MRAVGGILLLCVSGCATERGRQTTAATLVEDGRTRGTIVIPARMATPASSRFTEGNAGVVLTAAHALSGFLQDMSGARVPVRWDIDVDDSEGFRIMIGSTALAPVDPAWVSEQKVGFDGFIIRSVPNGIVIAGRNDQGTANGVYHFAEQMLGIHWYSFEDLVPTIPRRSTVRIPRLDMTVKPDFDWRHQSHSIAGKYLGEFAVRSKSEAKANYPHWHTFNRVEGIVAECHHVFFRIVPDSLFETHPEYFALIDGKRKKGRNDVQRCLSNPDVLQLAINDTRRYFEREPALRFATLSANDGGGWCECTPCAAMGPTQSDRSLLFCNRVAEANESLYPTRGYVFYAYDATLDPPLVTKAHRNVIPMVADLGACRLHPMDSDCRGPAHKRKVYEGWQKAAGRISWRGYIVGGRFSAPGVITAAEEYRLLRDRGCIGGMREHTASPKANWAILNWMEVKLMWDVDRDPVKLRRQFIAGYYGRSAADVIERIYDRIETSIRNSPTDAPSESRYAYVHNRRLHWDILGPIVEACRGDLEAALRIAEGEKNATHRRRIARDMGALLLGLPADMKGLLAE